MKFFIDDTSVFSTVYDNNASRDVINGDLDKIAEWGFKWKMQFNPDLNKQAQGITFSIKTMKPVSLSSQFNDSAKAYDNFQKQLGLFLGQNLSFSHHMKKKVRQSHERSQSY